MLNPIGVFSLQLACQLLVSKNYSSLIDINDIGTPLVKSAEELPDGYTAFPDIGVAYKHHQTGDKVTWNEARESCEAEGGNLAIIDSLKKIEYLKGMGMSNSVSVWVGIHRFFGEGWTSIKDGSLRTPLPWRSDSQRGESSYQCCAVVTSSDVGLRVGTCSVQRHYICEVSIFKDVGLWRTQSLQLN